MPASDVQFPGTPAPVDTSTPPPATAPIRNYLDSLAELSDVMAQWGAETRLTGSFPHREFTALRELGAYEITLPGNPLAVGTPCTAELLQYLKLVGRASLPVGRIYEGHINALELIHLYGTPEQQQRYYQEARDGHLFGVWNTEMWDGVHIDDLPGGGTPVQGSPRHASRLRGCKSFCSGSVHVTRPIITGVRHGPEGYELGWQMCLPELDRQEATVDESFWTPLGMENSVSYKLDFTGLLLRPNQLLGAPDDYETQPHFSGGAIRFAAVQLGGAEALLDATRAFLRKVKRTENSYQRTRVARMAILVETGNQWIQRAGHINDHESDPERVITFANMTRTVILDICTECLQLAERCVGSRGLMHPGRLARLHTDLSMYLRQPAPDATQEQVGQYHLNDDQPVHSHWNHPPRSC